MVWTGLNLYTNEELNLYLYSFTTQPKLQKDNGFEPNAVTKLSQLFLVIWLSFAIYLFHL